VRAPTAAGRRDTGSGPDYAAAGPNCQNGHRSMGTGTTDTETFMDWPSWAERLEAALGPEGDFPSFFAPGALFSDPVNAPTSDIAAIEEMTNASFPDWRQEITSVHGDGSAGAFEWIGRGTLGGTIPIEIHGCTVVDVNADGLVTRWRDYFDLKEIDAQVASPPG
jgi:hypothetical protein